MVAACGARNNQVDSTEQIPEGTYSIDPIFRAYYLEHGGVEVFGHAISTQFSNLNGEKLQYLETVLMVYNPDEQRIYFQALGAELGVQNYPTGSEEIPANSLEVDGFFIHPAFLELYSELGPDLVGQPLTNPFYNYGKNRLEQHFANLGFFYQLDDPAKTPKLLSYGRVACPTCKEQGGLLNGFLEAPLSDANIYAALEKKGFSISMVGNLIKGPAERTNGNIEAIFDHVVVYFKDGKYRLKPLPEILGLAEDNLYAPIVNPQLIFIEVQNGLGHNVFTEFNSFILSHGGYKVFGWPVSEVRALNAADQALRQCFRFLCLDYYPNAVEEKVRPAVLGHQYLDQVASTFLDTPSASETVHERNTSPVSVQTWEDYVKLNSNTPQIIFAMLTINQVPQPGKVLTLIVTMPDGSTVTMQMPETDQDGQTSIQLAPISADNGQLITYKICYEKDSDPPVCQEEMYMIWGNP